MAGEESVEEGFLGKRCFEGAYSWSVGMLSRLEMSVWRSFAMTERGFRRNISVTREVSSSEKKP